MTVSKPNAQPDERREILGSSGETGIEPGIELDVVGEGVGETEVEIGGPIGLLAEDADKLHVPAEFFGEVAAEGEGGDELGVATAISAGEEIDLGHGAEAPAIRQFRGEGNDKATFDFIGAKAIGGGRNGHEGHKRESRGSAVVAPEIPFEAESEIAKALRTIADAGVNGRNNLEIDVIGQAELEIGIEERPGGGAAVAFGRVAITR